MPNCEICGRELTNPLSIQRGIGPVCWSKIWLLALLQSTSIFDQGAETNKDDYPPLEHYLAQITRWDCPLCGSDLHKGIPFHFKHESGWFLHGFHYKQQILIMCLRCKVNIPIHKLGVPLPNREEISHGKM